MKKKVDFLNPTLNVISKISRCLLSFAIWSALAGYSLSYQKIIQNHNGQVIKTLFLQ